MLITAALVAILTGGMVPPDKTLSINDRPVMTEVDTLSETLWNWSVQSLELPDRVDTLTFVDVVVGSETYELAIEPHNLRSDKFQVLLDLGNGVFEPQQVDAPRTVSGRVVGYENSRVAGSVINGQFRAIFDLGDGLLSYGIEPLTDHDPNGGHKMHVVYEGQDVIPTGHTCGVEDGLHSEDPDNGGNQRGGDKTAEIAFDTDFEFYNARGQNGQTVTDDIENVMVGVDVIYERDVNICHKITTIIIRSNSNDPYTSNDPNTLLNQFRNHWNSSQGGVVRDTAHMFTGRSASQTIGIAYLSVICNRSSAYGISWTTYTSNYQSRVGLTAHELGHNWGAGHCCGSCSGCSTCNIMCPCIRGCSGNITNFGSSSIAAITSHRNSRNCLDDGCNGGGTNDPTCADFQAVKLRCKSDGTLKPKVVMFTEDFDGKTVTVTIDGSFDLDITINGRRGKGSVCCFGLGQHTVVVTTPNCPNLSRTTTCN